MTQTNSETAENDDSGRTERLIGQSGPVIVWVITALIVLSVLAPAAALVGTQPAVENSHGVAQAQAAEWPVVFENTSSGIGDMREVAISPSENYVAVAVGTGTNSVLVYEIPSGDLVYQNQFESQDIVSVAWSPSGDRLAYIGDPDEIGMVDTGDWTTIDTAFRQGDGSGQIDWHPDGSELAVAGTDSTYGVEIYDTTATSISSQTTYDAEGSNVQGVAYSPSGDRLAYGAIDGGGDTAGVLDTSDYTQSQQLSPPGAVDPISVAWSPDGTQLAYSSADSSGDAVIYDTTDYSVATTINQDGVSGPGAIAYSPDSQRLAFAYGSSTAPFTVYNTTDWSVTRSFNKEATDVSWSTNYVAVGGNQLLTVYDSEAATTPTPTPTPTPGPVSDNLTLEIRNLIQPNMTHPYQVFFEGEGEVTGSANLTVTSSNTSVLTVDESNFTVTAVNDSNVSQKVTVTATYTTGGETYTARQTVVVAEPTVENMEIVPGIWRFAAVASSDMLFALLIATLFAVPAARFTSAFGGLSVGQLSLVIGWLAGYVTLGMVMVSVFVTLFIGLNMAANIDYQVRR